MSTKKSNIYVFLFDGFSDWEIAYLTPEIQKSTRFNLVYFSGERDLITSMGGLQIQPHTSLENLESNDMDLLVLPGGTAWEKGQNTEIEKITKTLFENGKPIAAICAATTCLGKLGILNNVEHTSNDLNYLKNMAPEYAGDMHYKNALAVSDKNIVTANGIAPIEFAIEIFRIIKLYDDDTIEKWFQLFKNGVWNE